MNDIAQTEIEAQYDEVKQAVDAVYEYDGGYLFCDNVLAGEFSEGLYSRLERFESEVELTRNKDDREFAIESMEAYIRTACKLDGVNVPADTDTDGESVPITDDGEGVEEYPEERLHRLVDRYLCTSEPEFHVDWFGDEVIVSTRLHSEEACRTIGDYDGIELLDYWLDDRGYDDDFGQPIIYYCAKYSVDGAGEPCLMTDGGETMSPEPVTDKKTQRDKVWVAIIDVLNNEEAVTPKRISEDTGVSVRAVRQVLHVTEEIGLFIRESKHANTYHPYAHVAIHPGI